MNTVSYLLSACVFCMASFSAFAVDVGTITVNGSVRAGTCNANISGAANATVALDPVTAGALSTNGITTGAKPFTISITGCQLLAGGAVYVFFSSPTAINAQGRLRNTSGTATNVEFQIRNATGAIVDLAAVANMQRAGAAQVPDASGNTSFPYTMWYYATGQATAGSVSSSVVYNLRYL